MTEGLPDTLKAIILGHLSKLELYVPAHGRTKKLTRDDIAKAFAADPRKLSTIVRHRRVAFTVEPQRRRAALRALDVAIGGIPR